MLNLPALPSLPTLTATAVALLGNPAAEAQLERVRKAVESMPTRPHLNVIRIGDDPASVSYTLLKTKKARAVGMSSTLTELPANTTQEELLELIQTLNVDPGTHGILVQLPLPTCSQINQDTVLEAIHPDKDVDGLHTANTGRLWTGQRGLRPCTAVGILNLLDFYGTSSLEGQHVVIVNASPLVGKPLAALMLERLATVTIAHKATRDLAHVTRQADLLVTATGVLNLISASMIKPGAIVIDVSINRIEGSPKLYGDCQAGVWNVASAVTPVPGGVGPMTVAQLLENTLLAAQRLQQIPCHQTSNPTLEYNLPSTAQAPINHSVLNTVFDLLFNAPSPRIPCPTDRLTTPSTSRRSR